MDRDLSKSCKLHVHDFEGLFWEINPLLSRMIKSKAEDVLYKSVIINYAKFDDKYCNKLSPETYIKSILNHRGNSFVLTPMGHVKEMSIIKGTIQLDKNCNYVFWVDGLGGDTYLDVVINSSCVNIELQLLDNNIISLTLEAGDTHEIMFASNFVIGTMYGYKLTNQPEQLWELVFSAFIRIMCSNSNGIELSKLDRVATVNIVKRLIDKLIEEIPLAHNEVENINVLKSELHSIDTDIMLIDEALYMHTCFLMSGVLEISSYLLERYLFDILKSSKL